MYVLLLLNNLQIYGIMNSCQLTKNALQTLQSWNRFWNITFFILHPVSFRWLFVVFFCLAALVLSNDSLLCKRSADIYFEVREWKVLSYGPSVASSHAVDCCFLFADCTARYLGRLPLATISKTHLFTLW